MFYLVFYILFVCFFLFEFQTHILNKKQLCIRIPRTVLLGISLYYTFIVHGKMLFILNSLTFALDAAYIMHICLHSYKYAQVLFFAFELILDPKRK